MYGLSETIKTSCQMDRFSAGARMNHYEKGRHTPDVNTEADCCILKLPAAFFYAESDELAAFLKYSIN